MGFSGEEALKWKLKYIEAFNAMERELKRIYTERQQWQIERDKGVVIRHILTDTIINIYPHFSSLLFLYFFILTYGITYSTAINFWD